MSNTTNDDSRFQGWTPSPNGRGTTDILWACGSTIALCSWTVLCLNLPAPNEGYWRRFRRKLYLTGLALVGPEFHLLLALGQWESARKSVADFHGLNHSDWTMTHAFFADAGGFLLHTPANSSRSISSGASENAIGATFPLDAKQLFFLVERGYVDYPKVTKNEISDKNKADPTARTLAVGQTLYFLLSCLGRAPQHLSITTLELTTLAYAICTFATFFFWAHKPSDVETAFELHARKTIDEMRSLAGHTGEYYLSPLEFVSRREWTWSRFWEYVLNFLRKCHISVGHVAGPSKRIRNDNFLEISSTAQAILYFFNALFSGINLVAWNFPFPSATERLLWRAASLTIPASLCVFWFWHKCNEKWFQDLKSSRLAHRWGRLTCATHIPSWISSNPLWKKAAKIRNLSYENDPAWEMELKAIIPYCFIASSYFVARVYILTEDIVAFRALPTTAYSSVDWSQYIPHI